jgi:uncharacterized delta-60 repeat protein
MKRTLFLQLACLSALFLSMNPVLAQDGVPDPTFGKAGKVWEHYADRSTGYGGNEVDVLVMPDGKILVVTSVNSELKFFRYTPDGSIDQTFGVNGSITTGISGALGEIQLTPTGGFYVMTLQTLYKFAANGMRDPGFGNSGALPISFGQGTSRAIAMAQDPGGKIIIAGSLFSNSESMFAALRFNPNGTYDTGFDGDGMFVHNWTPGSESAVDVLIQPDGKILLGGLINVKVPDIGQLTTDRADVALLRLHPNGSFDQGFGTGGKATAAYPLQNFSGGYLALQPDGKIIAAGAEYNTTNNESDMGVYRFLPDGTLDPAFGRKMYNSGATEMISDLAIQEDGKILLSEWTLCYSCSGVNTGANIVVLRILPDGTLDPSFNGGKVTLDFDTTEDHGGALASQGPKLIVAGLAPDNSIKTLKPGVFRLHNSSPIRVSTSTNRTFYRDMDGDQYGHTGHTVMAQARPAGFADAAGDCNDSDPSINPASKEIKDGRDNNCNGEVDEGFPTGPYVAIPAKIEAENWSRHFEVGTEPTRDAGGGLNLGYIDPGNWVEYNIYVPQTGTYVLDLRVASPHNFSRLQFTTTGNSTFANVIVPNTGDWQSWTTVRFNVGLSAGNQTIRLTSTGSGYWNINWLDFVVTPPNQFTQTIPGRIEAERYDAMRGIHTQSTTDAGGGLNVGYIDQGDWMKYSVNVPSAGLYNVSFRVATPHNNTQFHLRIGNTVSVPVDIPVTGSYQSWTNVNVSVLLEAGINNIRLLSTRNNWNLNWMEFTASGIPAGARDMLTYNTWMYDKYYFNYGTSMQQLAFDRETGLKSIDLTNNRVKFYENRTYDEINENGQMISGLWSFRGTNQLEVVNHLGSNLSDIRTLRPSRFEWVETTRKTSGEMIPVSSYYWPAGMHVQGENYTTMSGVQLEYTSDAGGGVNVAYNNNGDWMTYNVRVPQTGLYNLQLRMATIYSNAQIRILNSEGTNSDYITLPNTGGWQSWQTVTIPVQLEAGNQTLLIYTSGNNWNLNWFELVPAPVPAAKVVPGALVQETGADGPELKAYPNPARDGVTLQLSNSMTGAMNVRITGMNGSVAKEYRMAKGAKGAFQASLDISNLAKGAYIITVQMQGWKGITRIIKQ